MDKDQLNQIDKHVAEGPEENPIPDVGHLAVREDEQITVAGNHTDIVRDQINIESQTNIEGDQVNISKQVNINCDCRNNDNSLDLLTCQKRLKAIYRTKRRGMGFLPGFPKEFSSDEFFVDLQLIQKKNSPTKVKRVELETYRDLLNIWDERGHRLDHVLVSGLAGTGKTTLVSRLAYQWAAPESRRPPPPKQNTQTLDHKCTIYLSGVKHVFDFSHLRPKMSSKPKQYQNVLNQFQLVFALDISKFQPHTGLLDAIKSQLLNDVPIPALESYLSANADKCLYLFDGYDELSSNEMVLSSGLLCGSAVIVTTRPNKVDEFFQKHDEYIQVTLNGFSEKSVIKFVQLFFEDPLTEDDSLSLYCFFHMHIYKKKSSQLLQAIVANQITRNFSHFPLLLTMMCHIYKETKSLPKMVSHLYRLIVEYMARHWKAREPAVHSMSFDQFKDHIGFDNLMIQLGKTALDALMSTNSKLIFHEKEFESPEVVEKGCLLGLISKDSRISGFDKVIDVAFVHKTFQEFCASVFLSSLVDTDPDLFKSHLYHMDVYDMEYVLQFCCSSSLTAAESTLTHIVAMSLDKVKTFICKVEDWKRDTVSTRERIDDPWKLPLILLREVESRFGFVQSLHDILKPLVTHMRVHAVKSDCEHMDALQYFTSQCEMPHGWLTFVKVFTIYDVWEDDVMGTLNLIYDLLMKMPHLMSLNVLGGYPFTHKNFLAGIASRKIEVLKCDNLRFPVNALHSFLDQQPCFSSIDICGIDVDCSTNPETLANVLQVIRAKSGTIKEFVVTVYGDGPGERCLKSSYLWCDIGEVLPRMTHFYGMLDKIRLHKASMKPVHVQMMCEAIINTGNKPQSSLRQEGSQDRSVAKLPLKELYFTSTLIADAAFKLADAMRFLGSLKKLYLINNLLDDTHFQVLGPALSRLPNLQELDITWNKIGNSMKAIIDGVNHSNLTHFDVSHSHTDLTDESITALSHIHLPLLQCLSLSGCGIGPFGAKALSVSLQRMPHLRFLFLSRNEIDTDGVMALTTSFQYIPKVSIMNLSENPIGLKGIEAIFQNLVHLPNLDYSLGMEQLPIPQKPWSEKLMAENVWSALLKECIETLQRSRRWKIRNDEYWLDLDLERGDIKSIRSIVKQYHASDQ